MNKMLRVFVISSWYPTRVNPTLGNFNEKFAEAAALYHETIALHVCGDTSMKQKNELTSTTKDGVKTHVYYFRKRAGESMWDKLITWYKYMLYYHKLYKFAIKTYGKPHVVHLNILYPAGIIALLIRMLHGVPYVVSENWTGYLPAHKVHRNAAVRLLTRLIARKSAALLPVTDNLKQAMIAQGFKSKYQIVPNVTDTQYFYPAENRGAHDIKTILHVSSLVDDHKNITGILDVMARLWAVRKDFELHIVGDGDAAPHIAKAQQLGLFGTCVRFSGTMTPQEIAASMRQSDFFLLFSNYENLPCVIVEAFASGLPVVSTTAGGIAEHLTPDKGILLEPRDEHALFEACNTMLDTCRGYNQTMLHNYALEQFSYSSVGRKLGEIYINVSLVNN